MNLNLPNVAVSDRVSLSRRIKAGERTTMADLEGPGCIRRLWVTDGRRGNGRQVVIRIYFDDEPVPHVEAPFGDFFGVMHGLPWYPINTPHLSAQNYSGYNCYFDMPFARSARIEMDRGAGDTPIFLFVDWHRFPGQQLEEPRRFCARWRREAPAETLRRGLPAVGRGRPRAGWSASSTACGSTTTPTAGATAGPTTSTSTAAASTPPASAASAARTPSARPTAAPFTPPRPTSTRACPTTPTPTWARPVRRSGSWATGSSTATRSSSASRSTCASARWSNDICATSYWYQEGPVRPFFEMPDWPLLQPAERFEPPWGQLPRGTCDLPLPDTGSWWVCGPFRNRE